MATHRIPILGFSTCPDDSGEVFFEPYNIKATNDVWKHLVCVFNEVASRVGVYGSFDVPQNYNSDADFVVVWTADTATAGDVEWDIDYRCVGGDDAESLDQAGTQESLNQNDTAPSAANERMACTIAATNGNFAAGDTCEFYLCRDGTDAGDTMNDEALVHGFYFQYTD